MKIDHRKTQCFEPVTITIETPQELTAIWHLTNMGGDTFAKFLSSQGDHGAPRVDMEDFSFSHENWEEIKDECKRQKLTK